MNADRLNDAPVTEERQLQPTLYDALAEAVDFADVPGRTTTMSVETTDHDPFTFC
ncbi:hypothetical protein [Streptomyces wuyuanensis]|uniref:hypothetical protein n=1 Tax=Streptomyces wuyuanensis TaxID=1196353 RepID=UPI003D760D83